MPLPSCVRISVEIYLRCDVTGIEGCITQRLDRVPDFGAALSAKQEAFAVREAGRAMMKAPRLMNAAEVAEYLQEKS